MTNAKPMDVHWDAIVIGSGASGMTAAAYLAGGGWQIPQVRDLPRGQETHHRHPH
ncbi:hypothetical protein OLMES_0489 [Oleiphilus messinensis]|uniref:Uncharacterized protein n=1 Tax=Oleiphilus messinensis TaxID=141451 RepID=A0A1Y0I2A0_9GAMM|nr:hypothetical protein OLMES_0489 [Oleiphilus messinensis]